MINVRCLKAKDKERWLALWNSYLLFYKEILPESLTEITWLLGQNMDIATLKISSLIH
jgi:hypothetical protein